MEKISTKLKRIGAYLLQQLGVVILFFISIPIIAIIPSESREALPWIGLTVLIMAGLVFALIKNIEHVNKAVDTIAHKGIPWLTGRFHRRLILGFTICWLAFANAHEWITGWRNDFDVEVVMFHILPPIVFGTIVLVTRWVLFERDK